MPGDYGKFRVGKVVYPLDSSLASDTLSNLDPPIAEGLDFFTAMLQIHMGDCWDQAIANLDRQDSPPVVAYKLPYDPVDYFQEQQAKFPLLALWRTESIHEERTFSWYHDVETWKCAWSLFPCSPAEMEILWPFLNVAKQIIIDRAEQGYDPSYFDSKEVWSDGYAGIEKLKTINTKFAKLQFADKSNLVFPTMIITFQVSVRENFNRNFLQDLAGVDTTQLLDGYQILQTKTDF